ncbi:MAG: bifunctional nuclease family protein [Candidatus Poribacteria bacterium]|nr:bifunctional nuclease family protein [Candidatus Poribacteria bacterium]
MVEVKIDNIRTDNNEAPVVILEEIDSDPKRKLLIWIGESEASAIKAGLENISFPRPMTHDLLKNIVDALSATVTGIYINAFEKQTFYAKVKLKSNIQDLNIDSRPSDALALAIRCEVPIYVEEKVIEENGFLEKEK